MENAPFFSIIILSYNKEKYIQQCLSSCINQTFRNIQIVVIDDCSQDSTLHHIDPLVRSDSRITLVKNQKNSGTLASRMSGIDLAQGEYTIFVDGDDYLSPDACKLIFDHISSTEGGGI